MGVLPKNKSPGLLEQDGAKDVRHAKEHAERISKSRLSVKRANWLREFHVRSGLTSREIVELIRPLCPGFDKPLLVKCENPEKYGIQLCQRVIRRLKQWEEEQQRERSSGRAMDPGSGDQRPAAL